VIVGIIDTVLSAALAAIASQALGAAAEAQIAAGLLAAVVTAAMLAALGYRRLSRLRRDYRPRFPN
jgi:hypothetical protein